MNRDEIFKLANKYKVPVKAVEILVISKKYTPKQAALILERNQNQIRESKFEF